MIAGMFSAPGSRRTEKQNFPGVISPEVFGIDLPGQLGEALLIPCADLAGTEIVRFAEIHRRHGNVDAIYTSFVIHLNGSAEIRSGRGIFSHRFKALRNMPGTSSRIKSKRRFGIILR